MRILLTLVVLLASAQQPPYKTLEELKKQAVDFSRVREPVVLGAGLIESPRVPGMPLEASVNFAFVTYRGQPPSGPGPCMPQGTGVWAVDRQYLYVCVPNVAQTDFEWARVPLQVSW